MNAAAVRPAAMKIDDGIKARIKRLAGSARTSKRH